MKNQSNDDSSNLLRPHLQVDERQLMQPLPPEPLLSDEDYGAIESAVMETARGRWFLAEYARRNRNADTEAVLSAVRRLERLVQSAGSFDTRAEVNRGMADIAQAIAAAQITPDSSRGAPPVIEAQAENPVEDVVVTDEIGPKADENSFEAATVEPVVSPEPGVVDAGEPEDRAWMEATPVEALAVETEAIAVGQVSQQVEEPLTEDKDVFARLEDFLSETASKRPDEPAAPASDIAVQPEVETVAATGNVDAAEAATVEIETISGDATAGAERNAFEGAQPAGGELFPIIELDEEAVEALLNQDPPRQELILPTNHLVTQRWNKELMLDSGEAMPANEAPAEPQQTSLVTFIDEEPAEESQSVFSAPLRLEPEEEVEPEPREVEMAMAAAQPPAAEAPRLTISEIEAMSFAKKATLFS
jgi:hypothetical protein